MASPTGDRPVFNPDDDLKSSPTPQEAAPSPVEHKKVSLGDKILKIFGKGKPAKENVAPAGPAADEAKATGKTLTRTATQSVQRSQSRRSMGTMRQTLRKADRVTAAAASAAPPIGDTEKIAQIGLLLSYLRAKNAQNDEGIFRQSAQKELTTGIKSQLDQHTGSLPSVDISTLRSYDAAVLLKQLVGELNLSPDFRRAFRDFGKASKGMSDPDQIRGLNNALTLLTPDQKSALRSVIEFCTQVEANSAVNKMTAANLGICFGPNLDVVGLDKTNPTELMTSPTAPNEAFAGLVRHFNTLQWT